MTMMLGGLKNKILISASFLLIVVAFLVFRLHITRPGAEPRIAIKEFMDAVSIGDLKNMRLSSSQIFYDEFVQQFGKRKFDAVQNIYDRLYQFGLNEWQRFVWKAESSAQREYERLLDRIKDLGRQKFSLLSIEERMQLVNDRAKYDEYILQAGTGELSLEDKNKIGDIKSFNSAEGLKRFIEREKYVSLPEEDQKKLGSSAALSADNTPEKLAFIDKSAISYISDSQKKEILNIPRSELNDPASFMSKHGEPIAKAFLEKLKLQWSLLPNSMLFPAQDTRGSLLRGTEAVCAVTVFPGKGQKNDPENPKALTVFLQKKGFRWIVFELEPGLNKLYGEAR
jgi:hypothetical protein